MKNVHYDVKIIHADPFGMLSSLHMAGKKSLFLFEPPFYIAGNRPYLGGRITFADDEIVRRGVIYCFQVEKNDIFSFDVCDTVYYEILETLVDCFRLGGFLRAYQMFVFLVKGMSRGLPLFFLILFLLPYYKSSGIIIQMYDNCCGSILSLRSKVTSF